MVVEGFVEDEYMGTDDDIFVKIEGPLGEETIYVPFYVTQDALGEEDSPFPQEGFGKVSSSFGFRMFLYESSLIEDEYTATVLVSKSDLDEVYAVKRQVLRR